jgi:hypothetical protein
VLSIGEPVAAGGSGWNHESSGPAGLPLQPRSLMPTGGLVLGCPFLVGAQVVAVGGGFDLVKCREYGGWRRGGGRPAVDQPLLSFAGVEAGPGWCI